MAVVNYAKNSFLAGAASVKVTPPLGTIINGDFIPKRALAVHDDLYARAIVFQKKDVLACIVIIDNCGLSFDFISRIKWEIKNTSGIEPEHVLIAPTHAHSCGSVLSAFLAEADAEYTATLFGRAVRVVEMAKANMVEAKIAFGSVSAPEHVVCRRYKMKEGFEPFTPISNTVDKVVTNPVRLEKWINEPSGVVDPELSFMAIQSLTGKWISVLANYSLHYVGDFEPGIISADYFGLFAKYLGDKLDSPGFVGIMSNGTSANANIWDYMNPGRYPAQPFSQSTIIAEDLSEKVVCEIPNLEWITDPDLSVIYDAGLIKIVKPNPKQISEATEIVKGVDFATLDKINKDALKKIYAREFLLLSAQSDYCNFPLQAMKIGNGIIGALPGEVFGITGLQLKETAMPFAYFSITMANAYLGYIVPGPEMELGGYETWLCRSSKLSADAEKKMKETLIGFFDKLKKPA